MMSALRLSRAPFPAKLIKLADIIDNTISILQHDPNFAPMYMVEKRDVLIKMADVEADKLTQTALYRLAIEAVQSSTANSA